MNALEIKSLNKSYEGFSLKDVSFEIPQGYIMGFVGENGAGKTTTIKAMLNIISKNGGNVKILGKDMDLEELDIKREIGYVSGEYFYPKKKISEITKVYKRFFDNWDETIYNKFLNDFNLNENKRIDELSKGMKMKFALSLALSHHAKLLILDEPTSGMDPVARDNLLELFQELVEDGEISILYSTHITSDLDKCADYITFIQEGRIIESCSKEDLLKKYQLFNTSRDYLYKIKENVISYKENAFGVNGLIRKEDIINNPNIEYARPKIDDVIIYFSEKRGNE
ncbi:ABC transporter ATP-binding protein [Hujiaoplasma nucleasis]|uniref:ABC transporter ATP-binding protein n=1 Tax=Hujiaoplasma nucleasis TaxID=2725268 RepID=A0A7L6N643_9MOLU|nr:ABC transporter ATP-binding protein [Hujiaoplasma nucleasis]QLY40737.1 ABC transporter ATP-binding protein [Hujiaoplasma nucleasis]